MVGHLTLSRAQIINLRFVVDLEGKFTTQVGKFGKTNGMEYLPTEIVIGTSTERKINILHRSFSARQYNQKTKTKWEVVVLISRFGNH